MIIGAALSAFGANKQANATKNAAAQQGQNQQSAIWGPQQQYLGDVYGQAKSLYGQQAGQGAQQQSYIQGLQNSGMQAAQNLMMGPQNPYLQGMAADAMSQVSNQFNSQVMPSLLGGGNAAGQLGGERYALLQNQAVGEAGRAMGSAANQIYGNAWNSGMQGQAAGLDSLTSLGNLGMQGLNAPWAGLANYSSLIGKPVMGSGVGFGQGGVAGAGAGGGGYPGGLYAPGTLAAQIWGGQAGQAEMAQNAPFNGVTAGDAAMTGFSGNLGGSFGGLGGLFGGLW